MYDRASHWTARARFARAVLDACIIIVDDNTIVLHKIEL